MLRKASNKSSKKPNRFEKLDRFLNSQDPLDEAEQESILKEFETIHTKESRIYRRAFGIVILLISSVYFYLFIEQVNNPYTTKFTGQLRLVTGRKPASFFLGVQAISLLSTAVLLLHKLPRNPVEALRESSRRSTVMMWACLVGSACSGAFWFSRISLNSHLPHKPGFLWSLVWEPAAAMLSCLMAVLMLQGLQATSQQIRQLRTYMYRFKKV